MVKLSSLKEKTMSVIAVFAGEPIKIEYKPGALRDGTGYYDLMREGLEESDQDKIFDAVGKVVVDWDLTVDVQDMIDAGYFEEKMDSDGKVVRQALTPPDTDTMKLPLDKYALKAADVPGPLFGVITEKVREDSVSGGKETKKGR